MSLHALTSPDAVLKALKEYDDLGRQAFLSRYKFGKSKSYVLVHQGKHYDSKAIAGVALKYQPGFERALRADQFSGGEETVQPKLEELGFSVFGPGQVPAGERVSEQLRLGEIYTRRVLGGLLGIDGNGMNQGVFRRWGTASVLLFVTERKTPDRTQYVDHLDGENLHWEGQERRRTDPWIIEAEQRGLVLLVFHRDRKDEFPDYGFRYL